MINSEEKRFQSIFPMIREYFVVYLVSNNLSLGSIRRDMGISGRNVLPKFINVDSFSIQTIEVVMDYFNLSYTDLEYWYNKRHRKKKKEPWALICVINLYRSANFKRLM